MSCGDIQKRCDGWSMENMLLDNFEAETLREIESFLMNGEQKKKES